MLAEDLREYERDGDGRCNISSAASTSSQLEETLSLDPLEMSPPPVEIDDPHQVRCLHELS
jgi:hypothetical protein